MCIHFLDNLPDRFGVCQACKSAARSQCALQSRSHQLVKICDVFSHFSRCTLGMHIEHPSIARTMSQTQLWMWGYARWFWIPACWTVLQTDPWEPSFCKSTHEKHPPFWSLSSSNHIWLRKVWYTWKLWFTFTLPTAGIMMSCAHQSSSSNSMCLSLVQGGNPSPDLVS